MAINAIGNGIPFPKGKSIPSSIKKSMVLWYDLKRQGVTNETMKANPKLIDLSGNGHDATCYNFAWSGISSIGGYYFSSLHANTALGHYEYIVTSNKTKFTFVKNIDSTDLYLHSFVKKISIGDNIHYKIKITGLDNFKTKHPLSNMEDAQGHTFTKDGIYEHNFSATYEYVTINLRLRPDSYPEENEEINITIEQLPLYPNALVADGVDDYVRVDGTPILTDYTVVAKRKILSESDGTYRAFAAKGTTIYQGAFILERQNLVNRYEIINFGQDKNVTKIPTDITYMTSNSYNGTPIAKGDAIDEDILYIFSRNSHDQYISAVLYSFILFNRTLTTKEINWVKENLIEGDIEL